MAEKFLIINADDCNLTPGVTQAILNCHDSGILTSTTWMVNLSTDPRWVCEVLRRKTLGVGIHLNLTLGRPVSNPVQISSLLDEQGHFRRVHTQLAVLPGADETRCEYRAQIKKFRRIFGRLPTHLDTHHQVHDHPFFLTILLQTADYFNLPVRGSKLLQDKVSYDFCSRSPESLLGDLNPAGYWRKVVLVRALRDLKPGIHEVMCHPGRVDADLKAISSFTDGRDAEWKLFSQAGLRRVLRQHAIELTHYGLCYTAPQRAG